jgi:hypothetical protein
VSKFFRHEELFALSNALCQENLPKDPELDSGDNAMHEVVLATESEANEF